jgi:hypothetical protein
MKQTDTMRNRLADSFADDYDGGTLKIYTGAAPANPNDAATGTLLATINLPTPAFGAAAVGVVSKSGTWMAVAADTGTAGYARLANAGATRWIDITVGEGAGELNLNETDIVAGNVVVIDTATYTQPQS